MKPDNAVAYKVPFKHRLIYRLLPRPPYRNKHRHDYGDSLTALISVQSVGGFVKRPLGLGTITERPEGEKSGRGEERKYTELVRIAIAAQKRRRSIDGRLFGFFFDWAVGSECMELRLHLADAFYFWRESI